MKISIIMPTIDGREESREASARRTFSACCRRRLPSRRTRRRRMAAQGLQRTAPGLMSAPQSTQRGGP